jgi:hypothetical protein
VSISPPCSRSEHHAGGSAFELIEESSDDEGDELTSKDIKLAREGESDEDSDDSETADVGPQIVMVSVDNSWWRRTHQQVNLITLSLYS